MKLKNISKFFIALAAVISFQSCEEDNLERANYVAFQPNADIEILAGSAVSQEISVYTTKKVGSDRTFNISVDEELTTASSSGFTVGNSVTVPANSNEGTFILNVDASEIGETIVLKFNAVDDTYTGEALTIHVSELCNDTLLLMSFVFDNWPEETSWELYNSEFEVIHSGDGYDDMTSASEQACLTSGDYYFVIYDSYGDGICCTEGEGSYTLSLVDGTVIATGGEFGSEEIVEFTIE